MLLLEGTNVHSEGRIKPTVTEQELEERLVERIEKTPGAVLVVTSAQNIDRLVTIYRATLQADRDLVMDAYTADIARATGNEKIPRPHPEWKRIHSYLPRWQAIRIKEAGAFERLEGVNPYRLFPEDLAREPGRYVMLFSGSEGRRLADAGVLDGAICVWSLWSGYLSEPSGQRLQHFWRSTMSL